MNVSEAGKKINALSIETSKGFLGKPDVVLLLTQSLAAGLHTLIEDISGVGKTTLVRCLAKASGLDYGRIQFTPDLLPGDITGMTIWEPVKREFIFRPGPIHHQFILADELNRAPARTQSALLEAMQEGSVTTEGKRMPLPEPFFVAATQNPEWYAGTYPLPESQLDRFGIKITPGYPDNSVESSILGEYKNLNPEDRITPITNANEIMEIKKTIMAVEIVPKVLNYTVAIGDTTRKTPDFQSGLSTRGLQHLIRLAQAKAVINERNYLIPEDILESVIPVMEHRITLSPEARGEGKNLRDLIEKTTKAVPVPTGIRKG